MMASSSARGLNVLKAIKTYLENKPNQWDSSTTLNKVKFIAANNGELRASFTVDKTMCNSLDTLHGGFVSSLVDTMSVFGQITHPKGRMSWTTNMNIVYLNAAFIGDEVTVQTCPLVIGRTTIMEVVLTNIRTGATVAKGAACFTVGSDKLQTMIREISGFDVNEA